MHKEFTPPSCRNLLSSTVSVDLLIHDATVTQVVTQVHRATVWLNYVSVLRYMEQIIERKLLKWEFIVVKILPQPVGPPSAHLCSA